MRFKISALILALLMAGTALAVAQAPQSLILEFVDGDNLDVVYPDMTTYSYSNGSILEGDSIPVGATVKTGAGTSVELRLTPNGTIVKLAKFTSFKVEGLATPERDQNGFTLVAGKIRAVAAVGSQYNIYTANTVAGVRGTDFSMSFAEGAKATLLVAKGKVEFGARGEGDAIANAIMVGAGQFADFFQGLVAAPYTEQQFSEEFEGLDIAPERMPVQAEDPVVEEEKTEEEETSGPSDSLAADIAPAEEPEAEPEAPADEPSEVESAVMDWLRDVLGMEIGSVTINGETWAKAVIQPTFTVGKLRTGLYIPVIYSENLFDPSTWYKPGGNDEWSFGTDVGWTEATWPQALLDAATDTALKIKFLEYGKPLVDPFFLKVGNLDSFTIGHGLLMRDYANDADFPSVRRIGLNLGLDQGGWGFEAMTSDLTTNEIFGGRLYVRPIPGFKLALGLSGVADLVPASVYNTVDAPSAAATYGDPAFIGAGLDLDLPIVTSDLLGIRLFADGAAMVPYVRNAFEYDGNTGAAGLRYDMVYANGNLKNWGASSGLIGNVLFVDWRLEYRYYTGAFTPAFFDSSYERKRSTLVEEWASYLSDPDTIDQSPSVMGVYGEGGASILDEKLAFELGYFWPWSAEATTLGEQLAAADDYLKATLVVQKGLIPVIDVAGSISYERKNFAQTLVGDIDGLSWFDENTTFSGELAFPVPGAPNLDLAFLVSTTVARDEFGDVEYRDDDPTKPVIVPAITLETRLHF
ncbi:MAG: FecR domain-containing protein [Spirochaetales bacterium]|nr:FecR domain-containing protein [Spirochaetales bacterium]